MPLHFSHFVQPFLPYLLLSQYSIASISTSMSAVVRDINFWCIQAHMTPIPSILVFQSSMLPHHMAVVALAISVSGHRCRADWWTLEMGPNPESLSPEIGSKHIEVLKPGFREEPVVLVELLGTVSIPNQSTGREGRGEVKNITLPSPLSPLPSPPASSPLSLGGTCWVDLTSRRCFETTSTTSAG